MLSTLAGLLEKIPLRRSDVIYLAPPAFHGWGLIATLTGLLAGATLVFDGRFSAERAVATMLAENCTAFVAVPTMLKRIMDLDDAVLQPLSGRLRILGSGGARLDPDLVTAVTERFGPVLHNLYGATEVSYITIATPADSRTTRPAPGPLRSVSGWRSSSTACPSDPDGSAISTSAPEPDAFVYRWKLQTQRRRHGRHRRHGLPRRRRPLVRPRSIGLHDRLRR